MCGKVEGTEEDSKVRTKEKMQIGVTVIRGRWLNIRWTPAKGMGFG